MGGGGQRARSPRYCSCCICTLVLVHKFTLCSLVLPPALPLYLLVLVCTIPGAYLYTVRFVRDPCTCLVLVRCACLYPCTRLVPACDKFFYFVTFYHARLYTFVTPVLTSYLVAAIAIAAARMPSLAPWFVCAHCPSLCGTCNRIVSLLSVLYLPSIWIQHTYKTN